MWISHIDSKTARLYKNRNNGTVKYIVFGHGARCRDKIGCDGILLIYGN